MKVFAETCILKWILSLLSFAAIFPDQAYSKKVIRTDFKPFFDKYGVEGCFMLSDPEKETTWIYNPDRCQKGFLPASTFKILNSLVGIETGVITDITYSIPWDGIVRQVPSWNRDHTLATAFRNSVVPWYQELARKIGTGKMIYWIGKAQYGKMEISDSTIDRFWLQGNSRITPSEQLDFIRKLIENKLPFSQPSIDLVKTIMIIEEKPDYIFRGKTGWTVLDEKNIGWFVGYLEKNKKFWPFVLNVESDKKNTGLFQKSREGITMEILKYMKLL